MSLIGRCECIKISEKYEHGFNIVTCKGDSEKIRSFERQNEEKEKRAKLKKTHYLPQVDYNIINCKGGSSRDLNQSTDAVNQEERWEITEE